VEVALQAGVFRISALAPSLRMDPAHHLTGDRKADFRPQLSPITLPETHSPTLFSATMSPRRAGTRPPQCRLATPAAPDFARQTEIERSGQFVERLANMNRHARDSTCT